MTQNLTKDAEQRISGATIRLLEQQPFFGTLLLNARVKLSNTPTACTDGQQIEVGWQYALEISSNSLVALLAHEVLHIGLNHVQRRGIRDWKLWNIACDAAVNAILSLAGFELPTGAILMPEYSDLSAEEIYNRLLQEIDAHSHTIQGVFPSDDLGLQAPNLSPAQWESDAHSWANTINHAASLVKADQYGKYPAWLKRIIDYSQPQVNWRNVLAQYLTQTRDDY